MTKKLFISMLAAVLSFYSLVTPTTSAAYGNCGCSCAMVCNNVCVFDCAGCNISQEIEMAILCCEQAHGAIGDVGPCQLM